MDANPEIRVPGCQKPPHPCRRRLAVVAEPELGGDEVALVGCLLVCGARLAGVPTRVTERLELSVHRPESRAEVAVGGGVRSVGERVAVKSEREDERRGRADHGADGEGTRLRDPVADVDRDRGRAREPGIEDRGRGQRDETDRPLAAAPLEPAADSGRSYRGNGEGLRGRRHTPP